MEPVQTVRSRLGHGTLPQIAPCTICDADLDVSSDSQTSLVVRRVVISILHHAINVGRALERQSAAYKEADWEACAREKEHIQKQELLMDSRIKQLEEFISPPF